MMPRRKYWLAGALAGLLSSVLLFAQLNSPHPAPVVVADENPRELYRVVAGQIKAFQEHDYPAAYAFAARGIRDKFPLEQFSDMVRTTYPQLTQSGRLNFAATHFISADHASLLIYLEKGDRLFPAIYAFVKEGDGWKIEGVELIRSVFPGGQALETRT